MKISMYDFKLENENQGKNIYDKYSYSVFKYFQF